MSNSIKAIDAIAQKRGGDDWDFTPSTADNLATARIEIVGGPKPKAKPSKEAPAVDDDDSAAQPAAVDSDE